MKKDRKKPAKSIRNRSGIAESLILSIIPTLILVAMLIGLWILVAGNYGVVNDTGYVSQISAIVSNIIIFKTAFLFGILIMLALNFFAYYVVFRIVRKGIAYPWCCLAVCLQLMAICLYVIREASAGDILIAMF